MKNKTIISNGFTCTSQRHGYTITTEPKCWSYLVASSSAAAIAMQIRSFIRRDRRREWEAINWRAESECHTNTRAAQHYSWQAVDDCRKKEEKWKVDQVKWELVLCQRVFEMLFNYLSGAGRFERSPIQNFNRPSCVKLLLMKRSTMWYLRQMEFVC